MNPTKASILTGKEIHERIQKVTAIRDDYRTAIRKLGEAPHSHSVGTLKIKLDEVEKELEKILSYVYLTS